MSSQDWKQDWIKYAKACWLADLDIIDFTNCEVEQIDLLMSTYLALDIAFDSELKIDTYNQSDILFMLASDKYDRKRNVKNIR